MRKLIELDDETFHHLNELGRDRMATLQELADEAFGDLLKKHNVPIDLKDALRKSAANENGHAEIRNKKPTKSKLMTATMKRRALKRSPNKATPA